MIDEISADGEISEEELDRLALAIERVLPKSIRDEAALKRKQAREARRLTERETRRHVVVAQRADARAKRETERARTGILYQRELPVRGAFRSEARREACGRLIDGDTVWLEREPDSIHDPNAILVLGQKDCELGYLPREEAVVIAPLLDSGAEAEVTVRRLWETPDHQIVPILLVKVRRGDSPAVAVQPRSRQHGKALATPKQAGNSSGRGCASAAALFLLVAFWLATR